MKVFVTGVAGQLGHDVMNELAKRGYEGIGTDIAPDILYFLDEERIAAEAQYDGLYAICTVGYHRC